MGGGERRKPLGRGYPKVSFYVEMAAITFEPNRLHLGERSLRCWGRLIHENGGHCGIEASREAEKNRYKDLKSILKAKHQVMVQVQVQGEES
jgi:hypothetical protein